MPRNARSDTLEQVRYLSHVVYSRVSKLPGVSGGLPGKSITHLSLLGRKEIIGLEDAGILFHEVPQLIYEVPQLIYEVPQLIGRRT